MSEFDPARDCVVHDALTSEYFPYVAASRDDFLCYSQKFPDGKVAWDGMLLDGWHEFRLIG